MTTASSRLADLECRLDEQAAELQELRGLFPRLLAAHRYRAQLSARWKAFVAASRMPLPSQSDLTIAICRRLSPQSAASFRMLVRTLCELAAFTWRWSKLIFCLTVGNLLAGLLLRLLEPQGWDKLKEDALKIFAKMRRTANERTRKSS